MTRRWEAPRLAYELAAEWAAAYAEAPVIVPAPRDGEHDNGRHVAGGNISVRDLPPAGKQWHDLSPAEQREVTGALASHARSAMHELARHEKLQPGEAFVIKLDCYHVRMCERAGELMLALIAPAPPQEEWELPDCPHCAELLAVALINVEVMAISAAGVADPSAVLRRLAATLGRTAASPREARDDR